jgi:hypothetical protein
MTEEEDKEIKKFKQQVIYKIVVELCRKDETFNKWLKYQLNPNGVEAPPPEEHLFVGEE